MGFFAKLFSVVPKEELDEQKENPVSGALLIEPPDCYGMDDLLEVMRRLRSEDGCSWDKQQDHFSLRPYLLEEAYEVVEAINSKDPVGLQEELGDLLLQVVFHCQVAGEAKEFMFADVVHGITAKLIRRHPHVFGSAQVKGADEVIRCWEEIKRQEKASQGCQAGTCAADVERSFSALIRAVKVQKKASRLGFDWAEINGALQKAKEELGELESVYKTGDQDRIEEEFGDFLFALVNVARFLNVDPEVALSSAVEKFLRRFAYIEKKVKEECGKFSCFTLVELDKWWEEAKNKGF